MNFDVQLIGVSVDDMTVSQTANRECAVDSSSAVKAATDFHVVDFFKEFEGVSAEKQLATNAIAQSDRIFGAKKESSANDQSKTGSDPLSTKRIVLTVRGST